jgi:UDP-N-acetylmuramoylalanine--D-glutamate ligase
MELRGRVLVIGFRRTGRAVARELGRRGLAVRVADGADAVALGINGADWSGVELRLGEDGLSLLDDVDLVVPSPGVPAEAPLLAGAQARSIPIRSEIEIAFQLLDRPLVAVTGTNGKSTTTTLAGNALAQSGIDTFTGGNLGTPLMDAVQRPPAVAVAEVSTFQLEWIETLRPQVACLLNVSADHLDRHGSFAVYRALKARLFENQRAGDVAVLNRDDPETWSLRSGLAARVLSFGWSPVRQGAFARETEVVLRLDGAEEVYDLSRTRLRGPHNVENVMAAALVARLAGATPEGIQTAIDAARPLPHRLALVAERGGVTFVDDSKATNVGAAVRAIEAVSGRVLLLAGGVDKGGDYGPLVRAAAVRVRLALVYGAAAARIGDALGTGGVAVEKAASLPDAVARAARVAEPGDTVLLAPACASFDMFRDYADRGRAFRAAVEALPGAVTPEASIGEEDGHDG